ncbi:MAG: acyl-ACP--UDP-N-acetylglucosamine O-acyltransferase [Proteobacteria bacterium]|nr:acyl-ACP--UDP-N-acetylglucosamine O-acyltransferase [Pseudomonadota bacterium]
MIKIDEKAIVEKGAELGDGVSIGPYSYIGPNVKMGKNCKVYPHAVIDGWTTIGDNCQIFPFASIGMAPQDIKYKDEKTELIIGNNNIIREYVTINRGTVAGGGKTVIGDNNFIMTSCHIAHDCHLGNEIVMANLATLAGHVYVDDFAVIGGFTAVHQFVRIGTMSMVGGASGVAQDVAPYTIVAGNRAKLFGLNLIGIKRRGIEGDKLDSLKKAYRIIFKSKLTLQEAKETIEKSGLLTEEVSKLLNFMLESSRGVIRW